ncbi:25252_t:CDS:2, partial [Racocetra persica]
NKQIKELQTQVKYWSNTATNYLKSLQQTQARVINLEEEIKEMKKIGPRSVSRSYHQQIVKELNEQIKELAEQEINKELEKSLIEANQKIRDQQKTIQDLDHLLKTGKNSEIIKKLEDKIKEQEKMIESLQKQAKNKDNNQEKKKEPKLYLFTCDICEQNKRSQLHRERVNGLGIDPNKINKICDYCIRRCNNEIVENEDYCQKCQRENELENNNTFFDLSPVCFGFLPTEEDFRQNIMAM